MTTILHLSCSPRDAGAFSSRMAREVLSPKNNTPPIIGPRKEPTPLKLCARFKRNSEVSGLPRTVIYGFAAVSRKVRPLAKTNKAKRKKGKLAFWAEG